MGKMGGIKRVVAKESKGKMGEALWARTAWERQMGGEKG